MNRKHKKTCLGFYLEKPLLKLLDQHAKANNISRAKAIRLALVEYGDVAPCEVNYDRVNSRIVGTFIEVNLFMRLKEAAVRAGVSKENIGRAAVENLLKTNHQLAAK